MTTQEEIDTVRSVRSTFLLMGLRDFSMMKLLVEDMAVALEETRAYPLETIDELIPMPLRELFLLRSGNDTKAGDIVSSATKKVSVSSGARS
jgi:hypothetical protein